MAAKKMIFVLALLAILPLGFSFDVSISPESPSTKQSEPIELEFKVTNTLLSDQYFTFSAEGAYTDWVTLPGPVTVPSNSFALVKVFVTPPRSATPAVYGLKFVTNGYPSGDTQRTDVYLRVLKKEGYFLKYLTLSKDSYMFNEPVVLSLGIQSNEPEQADVTLRVHVDGPKTYNQNFVYTIPADKLAEFTSNLQLPGAPAGTYDMTVTLQRGFRTFDTKNFVVKVVPTTNVEQNKQSRFLFYKISTTIEVENTGNVEASDIEVSDSIPTAWAVLTTSKEPFNTGATGFVWNIPSLSAGDKKLINYEIALWPLYILMTLAAFGAYKTYARVGLPGIAKTVVQKGPLTRGSEARVMLHIKNRTGRTVRNVIVDDTIPASLQLIEASVPKPKIRVTGTGQNVRWNVGSLGPREERVLSYRIRQSMGVIGRIILPKAWMRVEDSTYISNEASAQGEIERKKD